MDGRPVRAAGMTRASRQLAFVGGSQTLAQLLAAVSGLLIVRGLTKTDYAQYTLAVSAISVVSVISEAGLGSGIMSLGGRNHSDPTRLRAILNEAMSQRRPIARLTTAVTLPVLAVLLLRNGSSSAVTLALCVTVGASSLLAIRLSLLYVMLQLSQDLRRQQQAVVLGATFRLAFLVPLAAVLVSPVYALVTNFAGLAIEIGLAGRAVNGHLAAAALSRSGDRDYLRRNTRTLLPLSLFTVFQSVLLIVTLAALGRTKGLAEIAALSRFAILFTILGASWSTVLVPLFARMKADARVARNYLLILLSYSVCACGILVFVAVLAPLLLRLLGSDYAELRSELVLLLASTAVAGLGGLIAFLNQARGWLHGTWLVIPVTAATSVLGLMIFDLSTANSAARFSLFTAIPPTMAKLAPALFAAGGKNRRTTPPCATSAPPP